MALPNTPKPVTEKFGFVGGNDLQVILDKLPDAVTEGERDILRARRDYLTEDQIKRFGLEEPKVEVAPPETPLVEPKVKRGRKSKK